MKMDTKLIYAQSSDIKSRTYLEYRRDMKQKAIAELEILPWLRDKIQKKDKKAEVEKFGGDKFIWFLRKGGITREPDFVIKYSNGNVGYVEFQYAKEELNAYDFKISKIAPKDRSSNRRVPKSDTEILYVIKPTYEFTILEPKWIIKNSKETVAAAWGNAPVFRVSKEKFKKILKKDKDLEKACILIDKKITLLDFQHKAIDLEKEKLSHRMTSAIDDAGFLIRDCFIWRYTQNQPKAMSLNHFIDRLDCDKNKKSLLKEKLNGWKTPQIKSCCIGN